MRLLKLWRTPILRHLKKIIRQYYVNGVVTMRWGGGKKSEAFKVKEEVFSFGEF